MDAPIAALQTLTAMITPAVLISAGGTLVFSTSSRLSRVVDRIRSLSDLVERYSDPDGVPPTAEKRALILDQLAWSSRRVMLLRSAMTTFYIAIGLLVATSLAVGVVSMWDWSYSGIPLGLSLLGSIALLYGSVQLIAEARLAARANLQELSYVLKHARRGDRPDQV
jgi:Protein of unknown function (DUF2721)